jgi:hypothetical protein
MWIMVCVPETRMIFDRRTVWHHPVRGDLARYQTAIPSAVTWATWGSTPVQVSAAMVIEECRSMLDTTFMSAPDARAKATAPRPLPRQRH